MSTRLPTSGSLAAFLMIVRPGAATEAMSTFSVPVTEGTSKYTVPPCIRPSATAST